MRKKDIEKNIYNVISNSTPDVIEDIITKCEKKKGFYRKMNIVKEDKKDNKILIPRLVGALAVMVLCIGGVFGFNQYNKLYKVDSVIDFDVNPSIELNINKNEKVISVNALNDDGKKILDGMDLEKVELDVAVNAIIGSMLKNGYISELENSILVSVKNKDTDKANKLKEEITNDINEILSASSIKGSVLSQVFNDDSEVHKLADENKVSDGKALLINKILSSNIKDSKGNVYTFESLSKLSINELNLLLKEKKTEIKDTNTSGTASDKGYIGKDKAKSIALKNAGTTSSKVRELDVELDADDGVLVYEVDFKYGNKEYEYEINAKTGSIIHKDVEIDDDYEENTTTKPSTSQSNTNNNTSTNTSSSYIGKDEAKSIALKNAGVISSKVRDLEVELDNDNGVAVYEVSFEYGNTEYDYEINAKTGKIIRKEVDKDND